MIQRLNSYNLLTGKVAEKVSWTICRPDKKSEKNIGVWKWTFHKAQYLKPSNINLASVIVHVDKKIVGFTDSTHATY